MHFIKEFIFLILVAFLIEGRRRSEIRDETRKGLSVRSKKNFDDTIGGLKRLNKLQRRLMGLKDRNETTDEDTEVVVESPMENEDLYQGDIILTEEQIDEIVDDMVEQAEEKKIDVSDIESRARKPKRGKRSISSSLNT
uniref:Secreted protein n=1 Tax=Strongyloides papillosus TaxID=174720 RepID=A0A0N5BMT7_STREA